MFDRMAGMLVKSRPKLGPVVFPSLPMSHT
jgi:hypothetical protein